MRALTVPVSADDTVPTWHGRLPDAPARREGGHTMLDRTSTPTIDADRIAQIAASSPLARVSWSGRGRAPIGYIKGMAVMFAVAQAKLAQGDSAATHTAQA